VNNPATSKSAPRSERIHDDQKDAGMVGCLNITIGKPHEYFDHAGIADFQWLTLV